MTTPTPTTPRVRIIRVGHESWRLMDGDHCIARGMLTANTDYAIIPLAVIATLCDAINAMRRGQA